MADAIMLAEGIEIVHVSDNPCEQLEVPVAGNLEVAIGELIKQSSGKGVLCDGTGSEHDEFMGIALTGNNGSDGSGVVNFIEVCTRVVCRVTMASALANTVFQGIGIKINAASSHVWTFAQATTGGDQTGWLWENANGTATKQLVLFDSRAVAGAGPTTVGQGLFQQPDTD